MTLKNEPQKNINTILSCRGCFWGVEAYFSNCRELLTLKSAMLMEKQNPTYEEVSSGNTNLQRPLR